jgi:hypothetical protein
MNGISVRDGRHATAFVRDCQRKMAPGYRNSRFNSRNYVHAAKHLARGFFFVSP